MNGEVQHELGELSAHVANLDKRLAALLEEERRVHGEIERSIAEARADIHELRTLVQLQRATSDFQRRVQGAVIAVLGVTAGGALLKLWQYLAQIGRGGHG